MVDTQFVNGFFTIQEAEGERERKVDEAVEHSHLSATIARYVHYSYTARILHAFSYPLSCIHAFLATPAPKQRVLPFQDLFFAPL